MKEKMHINLNDTGSRSLDVEVTKEYIYFVANKITKNDNGNKEQIKMKRSYRATTYENLFKMLYNEFKGE